MTRNGCSSCRYWDSVASSRGLCRRNAPRSHMVAVGTDLSIEARWPETVAGDWCGQHSAADDRTMPVYAMREEPAPASAG